MPRLCDALCCKACRGRLYCSLGVDYSSSHIAPRRACSYSTRNKIRPVNRDKTRWSNMLYAPELHRRAQPSTPRSSLRLPSSSARICSASAPAHFSSSPVPPLEPIHFLRFLVSFNPTAFFPVLLGNKSHSTLAQALILIIGSC